MRRGSPRFRSVARVSSFPEPPSRSRSPFALLRLLPRASADSAFRYRAVRPIARAAWPASDSAAGRSRSLRCFSFLTLHAARVAQGARSDTSRRARSARHNERISHERFDARRFHRRTALPRFGPRELRRRVVLLHVVRVQRLLVRRWLLRGLRERLLRRAVLLLARGKQRVRMLRHRFVLWLNL